MTTSAIGSQTTAIPTSTTASTAAADTSSASAQSSGSGGGLSSLFGALTKRYKPLDATNVSNDAAEIATENGLDMSQLLAKFQAGQSGATQATQGAATASAATAANEAATGAGVSSADGSSATSPTSADATSTPAAAAASDPDTQALNAWAATNGNDPTSPSISIENDSDAASQEAAVANEQEQADVAAEPDATATPTTADATSTPTDATSTQAAATTSAQAASTTTSATTHQTGTPWNVWNVHMAQYKGAFNPDGPSMAPNCGPTSVTMALRLVGLDVPGTNGAKDEATIDQARIIGTGTNDQSVGTTDSQLEKVISSAGGQYSETTDLNQVLSWARQGTPTILAGDPAKGWDSRYSSSQIYPFDGGHWVVVSGYDSKTGYYIVNDPLSQIGPIEVSASELQGYMSTDGGLGIGVFK